eukprot:5280155-Amphidinium_carterae.2
MQRHCPLLRQLLLLEIELNAKVLCPPIVHSWVASHSVLKMSDIDLRSASQYIILSNCSLFAAAASSRQQAAGAVAAVHHNRLWIV